MSPSCRLAPRAGRMRLARRPQKPQSLVLAPHGERLEGAFAQVLRDDRSLFGARRLGERQGGAPGLLPVLLLLVDVEQVAQCLDPVGRRADEVAIDVLGPVEHPRAEVVLGQLQVRLQPKIVGERGTGDEVLMEAYRAVDLPAPPIEVSERELRLRRLLVDLEDLDEHLDRAVRLVVQQVVEPAEVVGGSDAGDPPAPNAGPRTNRTRPPPEAAARAARTSSCRGKGALTPPWRGRAPHPGRPARAAPDRA